MNASNFLRPFDYFIFKLKKKNPLWLVYLIRFQMSKIAIQRENTKNVSTNLTVKLLTTLFVTEKSNYPQQNPRISDNIAVLNFGIALYTEQHIFHYPLFKIIEL